MVRFFRIWKFEFLAIFFKNLGLIWKESIKNCRFFFQGQGQIFFKNCQKFKFPDSEKAYHATHPLIIVIICATHKKNPSRTAEQTQFSMSRPNDLEDIGQGQRSSHATHPLMLLIICTKFCTKYGKNPSWTVDATGPTWKVNGQTDGRTDRQGESNILFPNFVAGGITRLQ